MLCCRNCVGFANSFGRIQCLIEIFDYIIDMFYPNAEPDCLWPDSGFLLFIDRHLPVCRRGWMTRQRFCVTDIDQPTKQPQRIVKLRACIKSPYDTKS
jgi:hypothetical protein